MKTSGRTCDSHAKSNRPLRCVDDNLARPISFAEPNPLAVSRPGCWAAAKHKPQSTPKAAAPNARCFRLGWRANEQCVQLGASVCKWVRKMK